LSQSVCSIFSDDVKKYSTRHLKKLTKEETAFARERYTHTHFNDDSI
jgi:hypothetical protein